MKNTTLGLGETEIEILAFEMSDEASESAAGAAKENRKLHSRRLYRPVRLRRLTN